MVNLGQYCIEQQWLVSCHIDFRLWKAGGVEGEGDVVMPGENLQRGCTHVTKRISYMYVVRDINITHVPESHIWFSETSATFLSHVHTKFWGDSEGFSWPAWYADPVMYKNVNGIRVYVVSYPCSGPNYFSGRQLSHQEFGQVPSNSLFELESRDSRKTGSFRCSEKTIYFVVETISTYRKWVHVVTLMWLIRWYTVLMLTVHCVPIANLHVHVPSKSH